MRRWHELIAVVARDFEAEEAEGWDAGRLEAGGDEVMRFSIFEV